MNYISIDRDNRVFHVDNECYVLFLGSHPDDEQPFVRIGNTSWLYKKIHDQISNVVMTPNYTGNPLLEVELSSDYHGQYLGDPFVVDALRDFFSSFNKENPNISDYNQVKKGEGRDLVYFYNNGNVTLSFQGYKIFDLKSREKSDRHYLQKCKEMKDQFIKNPLRCGRDEFNTKGFYLTDKDFYLYENASLFGLRITKDYYRSLNSSGVDADMLQGALIKLSEKSLHDDQGETFIRFLKRAKAINKSINIFSFDEDMGEKLSKLLPKDQNIPSILKLNHVEEDKSFNWKSYTLNLKDGCYQFSLDGRLFLWARGGKELLVDQGEKSIPYPLIK
jgi:hypothetical protein